MSSKKRKQKAARATRNKRKRDEKTALAQELVEDCWNSYAIKWGHHSECFRIGEHYKWMAGFMQKRDRILEIGTGDGAGTVALFQNCSTLLSIDHNPKCLDIAHVRLSEAGIPVRLERRGEIQITETGFRIEYATPQSVVAKDEVLLMEGDIANDDDVGLEQWLASLPEFDAIACWNIGTYSLLVDSFGTPSEYRLRTQNVAYELADRILRPGGVFHIVDRAPANVQTQHDALVNGLVECHRDQARGTSLTIDAASIARRNFTLDADRTGIVMKNKDESGQFTDSSNEMVFLSIFATKP